MDFQITPEQELMRTQVLKLTTVTGAAATKWRKLWLNAVARHSMRAN